MPFLTSIIHQMNLFFFWHGYTPQSDYGFKIKTEIKIHVDMLFMSYSGFNLQLSIYNICQVYSNVSTISINLSRVKPKLHCLSFKSGIAKSGKIFKKSPAMFKSITFGVCPVGFGSFTLKTNTL